MSNPNTVPAIVYRLSPERTLCSFCEFLTWVKLNPELPTGITCYVHQKNLLKAICNLLPTNLSFSRWRFSSTLCSPA
jgi:hypothetical protein